MMNLGVLCSGGKDSIYALHKAHAAGHHISCLITIHSDNPHSYMFHTPTIQLTQAQSESLNIPLIKQSTSGTKEHELNELQTAIQKAMTDYKIEGIVTGALASTYQASRIQSICSQLGIWCFNPLWQADQYTTIKEMIQHMTIIITAIAAYPLDETWIGKHIDTTTVEQLKTMQQKFQLSPTGEGGEFETLVLDAPLFTKKINITKLEKIYHNHAGHCKVAIELIPK